MKITQKSAKVTTVSRYGIALLVEAVLTTVATVAITLVINKILDPTRKDE